jgi:hypothetical protein
MIDKIIIRAIISGIVWWFTYLYIRRYFNPENKGNIDKYRLDGLYGGIASFFGVLISYYLTEQFLK